MSDNVPFEIQMEIVQRIPDIKSVIQYRSVSKAWRSVIDSKDFVASHTRRHHQANRHLLVRIDDTQAKYVSIVDDDSFPHQKVSVFVPDSLAKFSGECDSEVIGTSRGLFCLFVAKTSTAVIWNPSIRKTVDIAVPNVFRQPPLSTVVGFGVCPRNLDPKLVKITFVFDWRKLPVGVFQDVNASTQAEVVSDFSELQYENTSTQVEVFTLSSGGTWRSPFSGKVPHKSIGFGSSQEAIDGFIYWFAFDNVGWNHKLIMSFDLTSEEFTKVNLPDSLAYYRTSWSIFNLRESLAVVEYHLTEKLCVWQMIGHGCTGSFSKLYSVNAPDASIRETLGFRKSGAPIIQVMNFDIESYEADSDYEDEDELAIYNPESKSITNIGISGSHSFYVHSYMETLLLLGQGN